MDMTRELNHPSLCVPTLDASRHPKMIIVSKGKTADVYIHASISPDLY